MAKDELKYKNWVFTWNSHKDEDFIAQEELESLLKGYAKTYCFQLEMASRLHYQGLFVLPIRKRKQTILNDIAKLLATLYPEKNYSIKNLTVEKMNATIEEATEYCTKSETSIALPVYSYDIQPYIPSDLVVLTKDENYYMWQRDVLERITDKREFTKDFKITAADDRSIVAIVDPQGNSGKSKFVKNLCFHNPYEVAKLAFGSAQQLRSAVISAGPKRVYFLDIPRTLGLSDNIDDIISTVEDIKNGFVVSSMYGKHQQLMMPPPHIVIFSNKEINPTLISYDRWVLYRITPMKTLFRLKVFMNPIIPEGEYPH
jgi:hypothetical protein